MTPKSNINRRKFLKLAGMVAISNWVQPVLGEALMKKNVEMPLIELSGTPNEVGEGWGQALADNMHKGLNQILTVINTVHKTSRTEVLSYAMKLWPTATQFDPELEPFVRGQAKGAGMSLEEAWATRCGLELLFVNSNLAAMCTTLAGTGPATPNGQSILGQNIDWFTGSPLALIHIERNDGLCQLVLPILGIGEYIINSSGLGCCLNGVAAMQPDLKPKISMAAYLPRAMRQTDINEARKVLEEACRGIVAVTLADAKGGLFCFESTLNDYEVLFPNKGFLVHANNYKTPRFKAVDGYPMIFPDSPVRTSRMDELATKLSGNLTPETLGNALADHEGYPNSICRHPDPTVPLGLQAESLGAFIMLPNEKAMLVAAGNPCTHEYVRYEI